MPLSDASLDLLVKLHQCMIRPGSRGFLEEREIPSLPPPLLAAEIRALVVDATKAELMGTDHPPVDPDDARLPKGRYWFFTTKGVDTVTLRNKLIPAAGRFVSRDDNLPIVQRAEQELQSLKEGLLTANDLCVTPDQRLAVISEVEGLLSLLKQPLIRIRAIYEATRDHAVLKWLAAGAGAGIVGAKADAAVNALLALLGL